MEKIPFDWDKYKTGEYDVVTRSDKRIKGELHYNPAAANHPIVGFIDSWETWSKAGRYFGELHSASLDLFLVPKKKEMPPLYVSLYDVGNGSYAIGGLKFVPQLKEPRANYVGEFMLVPVEEEKP